MRVCLFLVFMLIAPFGSAYSEEYGVQRGTRKALVIGNARYRGTMNALRNPIRDAKAVARALKGTGFRVTTK